MPLDLGVVRTVMIFSDDPSASSAWWGRLLDLPVLRDDQLYRLELPSGVELAFHPEDVTQNPPGASTVVYWRVEALDAALRQVIAAGGRMHRGPLVVDDARRIAQVRDPFGAVVGLDGP